MEDLRLLRRTNASLSGEKLGSVHEAKMMTRIAPIIPPRIPPRITYRGQKLDSDFYNRDLKNRNDVLRSWHGTEQCKALDKADELLSRKDPSLREEIKKHQQRCLSGFIDYSIRCEDLIDKIDCNSEICEMICSSYYRWRDSFEGDYWTYKGILPRDILSTLQKV